MVILATHYGEYTGVEARGEDLDHGEEDLWSGGAEGHEGEVGDCAVPHGHEDPLLLAVDRHLGTGVGGGVGGEWWGGEGGMGWAQVAAEAGRRGRRAEVRRRGGVQWGWRQGGVAVVAVREGGGRRKGRERSPWSPSPHW